MKPTGSQPSARKFSRPSLKVPRTKAERARLLLSKMRLIDRNFELRAENGIIAIPLVRDLERSEMMLIENNLGQAIPSHDEFVARRTSRPNLELVLANRVPIGVLPDMPKSFDIIGDLAVLELNSTLVPYERELAQGILQVLANVRAVFARTGPTSGSERIRPLRHIGGENRTTTVHREFGCVFNVDISKAFFSPRLSTEHQRVARQVSEGETVVDMFSGVGPFSILIARSVKSVSIDAIDVNPDAVKMMTENVRTNRVASKVHVHLGDAREVASRLGSKATRVIMNHPSRASEFVPAASSLINPLGGGTIHYYTFAQGDEPENMAKAELREAMGSSSNCLEKIVEVRRVREVAPMKWQMAIDARIIPQN